MWLATVLTVISGGYPAAPNQLIIKHPDHLNVGDQPAVLSNTNHSSDQSSTCGGDDTKEIVETERK
ncbi:hypothetical protein PR003_g34023 [Phytophthora rubi]|uniref:Uncharacterized protein n=2 Tax=Phytophthora TaxID=4783 RepID=A0A6A3G8Q5_9STRA|nr:hypothetical protein PR001_g32934 [Phytophthora rubi]KAE8953319.1 hypothetical protein PR002_g32422 [Phytophthora rubi]KAE9261224.1 hypothetical protein PR003_g34023 [Phytophthora rubi]KAE9278623.1 hypothetical protein PF008_g28574 [Phytophthora fragariae]